MLLIFSVIKILYKFWQQGTERPVLFLFSPAINRQIQPLLPPIVFSLPHKKETFLWTPGGRICPLFTECDENPFSSGTQDVLIPWSSLFQRLIPLQKSEGEPQKNNCNDHVPIFYDKLNVNSCSWKDYSPTMSIM